MRKINKHYLMIFLITISGLSSEMQSYDNRCSSKKECDKIERNRNKLMHKIEDNIRDLRWNIEDYGSTQATYEKLDKFDTEIKSLCMACATDHKKTCHANQHTLDRKLNNAVRLADRHTRKKMKKNSDNVKIQGRITQKIYQEGYYGGES